MLDIYTLDDEVLREDTEKVTVFDNSLKMLVDAMFDTLVEADGVGLAAPQIGVSKKFFIVDLRRGDDRYYYSLALTGFRREFLRDNVIWLFPTAAAGAAAVYIGLRAVYRALIRSGEKGKGRR